MYVHMTTKRYSRSIRGAMRQQKLQQANSTGCHIDTITTATNNYNNQQLVVMHYSQLSWPASAGAGNNSCRGGAVVRRLPGQSFFLRFGKKSVGRQSCVQGK
ncbi:unnamed protein product [Ceratitis capitata]|uniref:(Mediterranean fruit fly) hypothetical protein n=1 Tax=Ceratitis capitata TaxID=7213 RepID=A0A811VBF8_CERCA|nr:unnamed protein product [Ceratitis capitata]